jgi:hypothetical protein
MGVHDIRDPPFLILCQKALSQWKHGRVFAANVLKIESNENSPALDKLHNKASQAGIILFGLNLAVEDFKPLGFSFCIPMLLLNCLDWRAVEVWMNDRPSLEFRLEKWKQPIFLVSSVQRNMRMEELECLADILLLPADGFPSIPFEIDEYTLEDPEMRQDFFVTLDEFPERICY